MSVATVTADLPLRDRVCGKILAARARQNGDAPFVHFAGEWHGFATMSRRANQVAHALAQLGIRAGQRVAILLRNRLEYLDLWFGLSRIGAIQVPVNCEYRAAQILHLLKRAPVRLVVAEREFAPELAGAVVSLSHGLDVLLVESSGAADSRALPPSLAHARSYADVVANAPQEDSDHAEVSGADPAVIMNTSGTTGPSKGVVLSHAQQYILGRNIAADMQLRGDDVYYNFFPLFHNTAQAMITMPVLLSGARMVLVDRFSASRFWDEARTHGCTAFYYIGEILRILLRASPSDAAGTPLRIGWGIGAPARDFDEFQERFGIRLRTGYGSTEANVPCYLPERNARAGRCGRALRGFEIRIANEAGEPVPSGTQGEILIRSSEPYALMLGYDGDPAATVAAWRDLWLHSGDAGVLDDDGQLTFAGRLKDAIRVRGENVSAFEVEAVIAALEGVLEVAAIAVPCELGGDDVKVVIVAARADALAPETVVEWARIHLPRFAVPRYVEFVPALPKTPTNKIQKHLLRQQPFTARTWSAPSREN